MTTANRPSRGFTMIEIMVAIAIVAIVTTTVAASFRQTIKTKNAVESQAGRYRTVRIALDRLAREIGQSYLSQHEDTSQPERRTMFVAKKRSDIDEVRFSFFGHQRLYQDANESDTAQVAYFGARDPYDSRKMNLARREGRRLQNVKLEDQNNEVAIVCDDVARFKLDYYDARDKLWREEWNTTTADGQPDRLPSKIRITLTVRDERGQEVPFQTQVRVAMQEPLFLRAVDGAGTTGGATTGKPPTTTGGTTTGGTTTGGTTTGGSTTGGRTTSGTTTGGGTTGGAVKTPTNPLFPT